MDNPQTLHDELAGLDGLVERLLAKAKYTDRTFDNSSLGEMYREAATALQSLTAQLAEAEKRCQKMEAVVFATGKLAADNLKRALDAEAALKGSQQ